MATNKEQMPESLNQANYEAAVLDFLDNEMAAVQPNTQKDESGQEVDALVTDLLKQVITESDQPNGGPRTISDRLAYELSESLPAEADNTPPSSEDPEPPAIAASPPIEAKKHTSAKPRHELPEAQPFSPRVPEFGLGMAPRRKSSMIAAASVCLLFVIGAAVYYLWGSSNDTAYTPGYQQVAASFIDPESMIVATSDASPMPNAVVTESPSPVLKPAVSQQIPTNPAKKSPATPSSGSVPASSFQDTAALKSEPATPMATDASANPISDMDSALIVVEPLQNQTSVPSPLRIESNLAIDKSIPPPMPDAIALASKRNPVGSVPAVFAGTGNLTPTSQSRTPAPGEGRNPVPSVLISQISPVYPELAIRSRTSGSVVLELQIDKEGKVVKAAPISGPSVFYSEAVKAAMQYRYRPATLDGTNVPSKSRVTMVFNLNR